MAQCVRLLYWKRNKAVMGNINIGKLFYLKRHEPHVKYWQKIVLLKDNWVIEKNNPLYTKI